MSSACTLVIRTRFSVSAKWAFSCASCALRWACWRDLWAEVDRAWEVEERAEEGRDEDEACLEAIVVAAGGTAAVEVWLWLEF